MFYHLHRNLYQLILMYLVSSRREMLSVSSQKPSFEIEFTAINVQFHCTAPKFVVTFRKRRDLLLHFGSRYSQYSLQQWCPHSIFLIRYGSKTKLGWAAVKI